MKDSWRLPLGPLLRAVEDTEQTNSRARDLVDHDGGQWIQNEFARAIHSTGATEIWEFHQY